MYAEILADLALLPRLIVAMILAGILGWEREATGKAAGLRTHMLVGIGAALFVIIGELIVARFQHYGDIVRFDPIRVLEAIVAGISFIGAGMIFVSQDRSRVRNLTTAASILTTAAVGLTVGLEHYVLAAGATAVLFVVLHNVQDVEKSEDG